MHKHRTSRGTSKWRNANSCIPESAQSAVLGLLGALGEKDDFASSYLHSQYLSKYCDDTTVPPQARRSAAIEKWLGQEEVNNRTNWLFHEAEQNGGLAKSLHGWISDRWSSVGIHHNFSANVFLSCARGYIHSVLGPLHDDVVLGSFSGGASTSRRRTASNPAQKFVGQADATGEVMKFLDTLYRESELFRRFHIFNDVREVEGAELFTVPKKTDIDRCACKEPDINMYLQKGVGRHIRSRLRRHGINLNDQSRNRLLAQRGSVCQDLATIDLSSASDSICINVVHALLPFDWYMYLNEIRSQKVLVRGEYVSTDMFSSMGNGFTFELESLIFWALTRATCYVLGIPGVISVYGDDIICPDRAYEPVSLVLEAFGFSVNEEKSFHSNHADELHRPFRESCGGHYYNGVDVTPFYLKRAPTHLTDVIRVANQLRRWAFADCTRQYEHPELYRMWLSLAEHVPSDLWGGRDYALDTQLVSPGAPNKRLVRISGAKELPDNGRYLHWHNSNWKRSTEAGEAYVASNTTTLCRKRPAPIGAPYLGDLFHEEIFA